MSDVKNIPPATDLRGKDCPYYPCHKLEDMLCDYCYCPLYFTANCGGDYKILPNGVKDCSNCVRPHTLDGIRIIKDELNITQALQIIDHTHI